MGTWAGIEGCDGTGKTHLAEALRDELESRFGATTLIHKGPPEKSVLEEYATDVEGREAENLVFDRWHLGTAVYAPLYRGTGPYGELGVAGFRWVEKFLQARGAVFYHADQPYDVVKQRLEARGEDYLQSHHVEGVLERFREVANLSCLTAPPFKMPLTFDEVPKLVQNIVNDATENARDHAPLRAFSSYVGGCAPAVLLVGERRGGKPPFVSQACFMAVPNRSGAYLWESLPDPYWKGVGAANAYEDDIRALCETLGRPPVVALGAMASRKLSEVGVPHATVPHPQKVKRFFNGRQQTYGELIAAVTGTEENRLTWPS